MQCINRELQTGLFLTFSHTKINKLAQPLDFQIPSADTAAINSAEDKIEKNKQWVKLRNTDVYIDEAVQALNKIIQQNNLVKSER